MTVTTNKGLYLGSVGGDSGAWGGFLNNNTLIPLDLMLGGVASIPLSSSNYTIGTASASEVQDVMVKLTGTLGANVTVFSPNIGFYFVENNTSGAFTVTWQANFGSGNVGSGIVIPQGQRFLLVSDTSAGARRGDSASIPAGTVTNFFQAAAPVGWVQNVSYNDYAMRIVSGTGGGAHSGGGFYAGSTDSHTLVTSEIPSHNHGVTDPGHTHSLFDSSAFGPTAGATVNGVTSTTVFTGSNTTGISIQNTGGGGGHSHTLAGLSMLDNILCSKN